MDHLMDHEIGLNGFQKIEILQSIFSDHNGIKLEDNSSKYLYF